jgi:UPF0755 protein
VIRIKKTLTVIVLLVLINLGFAWGLWLYLDSPTVNTGGLCSVEIPNGTPFNQVANMLEKEGVITGSRKFRWLAWLQGIEKEIKAGDYTFRTGMKPSEVIDMLVEGRYATIAVTIPEGFTLAQIARIFQEKGLGQEETFLALSVDPQCIQSLQIEGNSLEGFLFPDTYQFRKGMGEDAILRELVGRFKQVYSDTYRKRADELGLSQTEVVTLASIIEKETSDPSERYIIGAVFHNRLKKGIPLQSDPTVIYGIKDFDGNLTKEDLQTKTAFNTYLIKGLPPHPIANPGEESIRAALYPSQVNYLYFVSKNNGTHHFSATLEEHNRAVDTYQKKRRRRK